MRDRVRAQRFLASRDWSKVEAGAAAAEDDRRDHHMQAIEAARLQEAGDGRRAAFDKDASQAARREAPQDIARVEAALRRGQYNAFDSGPYPTLPRLRGRVG